MLVALISSFFFRLGIIPSIIILLPMIIDGVVQMLTSYESNNIKRFVTGVFFGYGFLMLFVITTIMAFEFGRNLVK